MTDIAKLAFEADSSQIRGARRDLKNISKQSRQTQTAVTSLAASNEATAESFRVMGSAVKTAVLAFGGFEAVRRGISTLADFGQTMSTVQAVSGATGDQLEEMKLKAEQLGATTRFSATQAAEGILYLSRTGFSTQESLDSVGATLLLAQSGMMDLGAAADIASNIMQAFQIDASKSESVVDSLAKAANSSNTDIRQLGDAMKFVGPVAKGVGITMNTTAAAIGALSNAGIQGGMAGTSLRRILSALVNPTSNAQKALKHLGLTADDVNVAQRGLVPVLQSLAGAGMSVADAMQIAGQRGGPALEVLTQSIPDIKDLNNSLNNSAGYAKKVAETMDDNVNGALLAVKSAAEHVVIRLGDLGGNNAIMSGLNGLASILRTVGNHAEILADAAGVLATVMGVKLAGKFGAATKAIYAEQMAMVAATTATGELTVKTKVATVAVRGFKTAMALLGGPAGVVIIAIGALFQYRNEIAHLGREQVDVKKKVDELTAGLYRQSNAFIDNKIIQYQTKLAGLGTEYDTLLAKQHRLQQVANFKWGGPSSKEAARQLASVNLQLDEVSDKTSAYNQAIVQALNIKDKAASASSAASPGGGSADGGNQYSDLLDDYDKKYKKLTKLREARQRLQQAIKDDPAHAEAYRRALKEVDAQIVKLTKGTKAASKGMSDLEKRQLAAIDKSQAAYAAYAEHQRSVRKQLIDDLATPQERASMQLDKRLKMINATVSDQGKRILLAGRAWDKYDEDMKSATDNTSEFAKQASRNIQDYLGSTMEDVLSGHFDNIGKDFTSMLVHMAAQAAAININELLFGKQGAGSGGGWLNTAIGAIGSVAGAYFGGGGSTFTAGQIKNNSVMHNIGLDMNSLAGFANGGRPPVGVPSIVGERGPELFVPDRAGTVVPNGGLSPNVNVVINNSGGQMQVDNQRTQRGPNGDITVTLDTTVLSSLHRLKQAGDLGGILNAPEPTTI